MGGATAQRVKRYGRLLQRRRHRVLFPAAIKKEIVRTPTARSAQNIESG